MAVYNAGSYYRTGKKSYAPVTLPAADCTISGDAVVWDVGTVLGAGITVKVQDWDASQHNDYRASQDYKPLIVIRCSVDCRSYNVIVANSAGTLYTFSGNSSSTHAYCVLQLNDARVWCLAGSVTAV